MEKLLIMKKTFIILIVCCSFSVLQSCRNAGKYADDVIKVIDDKADDLGKGSYGPKRAPRPKQCSQCNGTGVVFDAYMNRYQCNNCGGDGEVYLY